jgi:hypothetical protein
MIGVLDGLLYLGSIFTVENPRFRAAFKFIPEEQPVRLCMQYAITHMAEAE